MVSIRLFLDKRRARKDGSYPLNFIIYYKKKTTIRTTGISLKEEEWDDRSKSVTKLNPAYKALNQRIKKELAELQSELLLADDNKIEQFLKPEHIKETEADVAKKNL